MIKPALQVECDRLREEKRELAVQFMRLQEICVAYGTLPEDAKMANATISARLLAQVNAKAKI